MNDKDFGFVELVDRMLIDPAVKVVNTARISFGKGHKEIITEKDRKLIKYLWKKKHSSPFRHTYYSFKIKAPVFVLRQWMKHQVGCAWNEQSFRYVEAEDSFHCPSRFRGPPSVNIKQGSGADIDSVAQEKAHKAYQFSVNMSFEIYKELLEYGVCKEQARAVLPLCIFTQATWTASLQAIIHFLNLRLAKDSQAEMRYYAEAIRETLEEDPNLKFILEVCLESCKNETNDY
jgi:thymidylate synthase (FAD)